MNVVTINWGICSRTSHHELKKCFPVSTVPFWVPWIILCDPLHGNNEDLTEIANKTCVSFSLIFNNNLSALFECIDCDVKNCRRPQRCQLPRLLVSNKFPCNTIIANKSHFLLCV